MPSGATHDRITIRILPWLVLISYIITRNGELTLLIAGGFLFSGFMFGPDLDIYSIQFKRWGKLRYIWIPYQKSISHRSKLSHGFLIGTTLRILYISFILIFISIFIIAISQILFGFSWNWQEFFINLWLKITKEYGLEFISLFCGLELGAMSHSLSDWSVSAYKKYKRKKNSTTKSKSKNIRSKKKKK